MNNKLKKQINARKIIVSFFLSFILLYYVFSKIPINAIVQNIAEINAYYFILAVIFFYAAFPLRAIRWKIMLKNSKIKTNYKGLTEIIFLSWFANSIIPAKLGDVYRAYALKKRDKTKISPILGTIFAERALDIVFLLLLLGITGTIFLGDKFIESINIIYIGLLGLFFFTIAIIIIKQKKDHIIHIMPTKIKPYMNDFLKSIERTLNLKTAHKIIFLTTILWLFESVCLYFVILSLNLAIPLMTAITIAIAGIILTAIPFTPAGLGAVEVGLFGLFVMVGVTEPISISIVFFYRLITYWSLVIFGAIDYSINLLFFRRTKQYNII